ncbi:MAG TPA: hypothetical protein VEW69_05965, partial [Alphaproteobacteria bacterium]|nr:hypothetical protein [Alphaproteobacteria bacterium]
MPRLRPRHFAMACLYVAISTLGLCAEDPSNAKAKVNAQYRAAAQQTIQQPFRVDIQPVSQGVMPGSPAILRIELRNASNNVVSTTRDMGFVVTAKLPSGAE